jgi:acetyl-CoA C-acetyltransferase
LTNVVITPAARTAIGSCGKSLAGVAPSDLGATAAKAAIERSGIAPEQIEPCIGGGQGIAMLLGKD